MRTARACDLRVLYLVQFPFYGFVELSLGAKSFCFILNGSIRSRVSHRCKDLWPTTFEKTLCDFKRDVESVLPRTHA